MTEREGFNRRVRRTAFLCLAFVLGLVFGIILLAVGDWIPGGVIVAVSLIGLAVEIPVIGRLCSAPLAPTSKPTS
jgi:hypothetical protein